MPVSHVVPQHGAGGQQGRERVSSVPAAPCLQVSFPGHPGSSAPASFTSRPCLCPPESQPPPVLPSLFLPGSCSGGRGRCPSPPPPESPEPPWPGPPGPPAVLLGPRTRSGVGTSPESFIVGHVYGDLPCSESDRRRLLRRLFIGNTSHTKANMFLGWVVPTSKAKKPEKTLPPVSASLTPGLTGGVRSLGSAPAVGLPGSLGVGGFGKLQARAQDSERRAECFSLFPRGLPHAARPSATHIGGHFSWAPSVDDDGSQELAWGLLGEGLGWTQRSRRGSRRAPSR